MFNVFTEINTPGPSGSSSSGLSGSSSSSSSSSSSTSSSSTASSSGIVLSNEKYIYVDSINGNDANDGTNADSAMLTLALGLAKSFSYDITNILVAQGTYNERLFINFDNVHLIGGWDTNFITQTGFSVIDGTGVPDYLIYAKNNNNIKIDGFILEYATIATSSGVMDFESVDNIIITNTIIRNNSAGSSCILYFGDCSQVLLSADIISNYGSDVGGVWIENTGNVTIRGNIAYNRAIQVGGVYINDATNCFIYASIYSNIGEFYGGLYFKNSTNINYTENLISSNTNNNIISNSVILK
jgi:hypothetical protein